MKNITEQEKRKGYWIMSKKKRLIVTLVILAVMFCVYNIFQFISVQYRYRTYYEAVPKEHGAHILFDEKDQLTYNVKTPDYLHFTGNLGVSDKKGLSLIIWPSLFENKFTYGIIIRDKTEAYEIYINDKLESVTGNPGDKEIVEKYNKDIKNLYEKAKEKFKKI